MWYLESILLLISLLYDQKLDLHHFYRKYSNYENRNCRNKTKKRKSFTLGKMQNLICVIWDNRAIVETLKSLFIQVTLLVFTARFLKLNFVKNLSQNRMAYSQKNHEANLLVVSKSWAKIRHIYKRILDDKT